MKGKLSYLLSLSLLLSACSYDQVTEVCPEVRMEPVNVTFTLSLQDAARTKADDNKWDGNGYDQEDGTAFENRILKETVKVFAYNADGTYAGEVPLLQWTGTAANPVFHGYFNATTAGTYKFVVIANCTNESYSLAYDYGTNMPDLNGLLFAAPVLSEQILSTGAIPMWGVTEFEIDEDTGDMDLGNVYMLRSLAKVEVLLSDALISEGYTINSASISKVAKSGYSLPTGWASISKTEEMVHDGAFHPYVSVDETNVTLASDSAVKYLYICEYENSASTATGYNPVTISLTLYKNGTEFKTYDSAIRFCSYGTDGLPISGTDSDIVRNHIYRFTVTKVATGSDLELLITISDWNKYNTSHEIEF